MQHPPRVLRKARNSPDGQHTKVVLVLCWPGLSEVEPTLRLKAGAFPQLTGSAPERPNHHMAVIRVRSRSFVVVKAIVGTSQTVVSVGSEQASGTRSTSGYRLRDFLLRYYDGPILVAGLCSGADGRSVCFQPLLYCGDSSGNPNKQAIRID